MLTADEVKHHLAFRIRDLARLLIPDGKQEGNEWRGHGPDGAKWGVVTRGGKVGCYQNFGAGIGGTSALALIRDAACGGDHLAAWRWALDYIGGEAAPPPAQPERLPIDYRRGPQRAQTPSTGLRIFLAAREMQWDDPVGCYLRARGIKPEKFDRPLRALRYHPNLWHAETDRDHPAMVAAIIDPVTRRHVALHRTFLARDAEGVWRKAPITPAKKVLGRKQGGIVPLTRGITGRPWRELCDADEGVLIAEGIENALTGAQWYPELRAIACIDAGNLPRVTLPEVVPSIMYLRDRDGENMGVRASREAALLRWHDERRAVSVWEPPEGCKDANDFWCDVQAGRRAA